MRLSQSPPFFTPLSYRSRQAAPLQCKLAVLASRTTRDQRGRRSRCCISSVLTHAPARRHSFLDRVWSSATTCTNVHRAWSAIAVVTPHDTLCVRWHNEVCSSFSLVRTLTDTHMQTVHRTSNIATMPQPTYPGEIMPELYDIINGVTQIEEMETLRSLGSPCFVMWVSKSGQCSHFPYHGLPTVSLTSTTLIPALTNTSF